MQGFSYASGKLCNSAILHAESGGHVREQLSWLKFDIAMRVESSIWNVDK